jgi:hypothetical protein
LNKNCKVKLLLDDGKCSKMGPPPLASYFPLWVKYHPLAPSEALLPTVPLQQLLLYQNYAQGEFVLTMVHNLTQ